MQHDNASVFGQIYDGAKELFVRGKHEQAIERFQSIYEIDATFRDVAEIVEDYFHEQIHDHAKDKWIKKYEALFREPRETV